MDLWEGGEKRRSALRENPLPPAKGEGSEEAVGRGDGGEILIFFHIFFFKIHPTPLHPLEQVLRSGPMQPAYLCVFRVFSSKE